MIEPVNRRLAGLMLCALAGCAAGPDFKPPPAPEGPGFVPAGQLPEHTASAPLAGGDAQHFVDGLDIPGQWWTLFQSDQLNQLIDLALKNNPTLQAAQASLRQANENLAAQRGTLFPSASANYQAERARSTAVAFGLPQQGSGFL